MNEEKKETSVKFQSKDEIARCIQVLTPFTTALVDNSSGGDFSFALEKIKELTKLL